MKTPILNLIMNLVGRYCRHASASFVSIRVRSRFRPATFARCAALGLCLLAMPTTAQVNYAVSGNTAYVTSSPNASGDIVIASTYNGYPVTRIGIRAFTSCAGLTSATIPESVTSIESQAFSFCTSLTRVTIPDSVTSLDDRAFQNCYRLTDAVIGSRVTGIGQLAFGGCAVLSSVTIPDSVTILDHLAFSGCTGLTNVTLGRSVAIIGQWAFGSCAGLTSVTLPDSVTNIWRQAFSGCTSLTSVTIGNGLSSIEPQAFSGCTSLANLSVDAANPVYSSLDGVLFNKAQTTLLIFPPGRGGSYVIPNSVTNTGVSAFANCTSLTNVTIPSSVTGIGNASFGGCTGLTRVTIPNSVSRIGFEAFMTCTKVTNFTFLGHAPVLVPYPTNSLSGRWFSNVGAGAKVYYYCGTTGWGATYGELPTVMLCPQVNYAVSGDTAYVASSPNASGDVVIASTFNGYPVTSIEVQAFNGCGSLTSVTIPNSVTNIGPEAFYFCTSLTNVILGNGVTAIGFYVFRDCRSLTSVIIPNSVTAIGYGAFQYCTSLTSVTLPNSVTFIEQLAFSGCINLTNVILGNSVASIGLAAFYNCTALTSVTIPNSVTSIAALAFSGCTSVTNFSVDAANPAYSSLNGVLFNKAQTTLIMFPPARGGSYVIPGSVTTVGNRAFQNCTSLTSVTMPNGVISIGAGAFDHCTGLGSVTIPDSVTQIGTTLYGGPEGGAFSFCTSLTNVIIGNSVTNIGAVAFAACSNLTRLTIPASVINLGYGAFLGSSRLTNFTFLGNAPRRVFDLEGGFAQFQNVGAGANAYYYCGTTGWGATYGGLPTVMLCPPQIAPGGAGMKPGGFGFALTRLTNQSVVEASADLVNWQPIWTNTLSGASADFADPEWLHHPRRFYRARSD